jgi:predicted PurR-regulated permease PerM
MRQLSPFADRGRRGSRIAVEHRMTSPAPGSGGSDEVRVVLPAATAVRLVLTGIALLIAINLIDAIQGVLIWSLAAAFLALALEPAIRLAEQAGLPRKSAVVSVYAGGALLVLGVLAAILVPLASQTRSLVDDFPRIADRLEHTRAVQDLDRRFHVLQSIRDVPTHAPDAAGLLFGLTGTVFGLVIGAVSVFFLALFASIELPRMTRGGLSLLPPETAGVVGDRLDDVNRVVARYVGANLAISVIAFAVHLVALELLGLPFAFVLALTVGLFDLVPLIGATIAGVIVCAVGFTQGVEIGIACIVLVVVYQQIENHVLQPVIMGKGVDISPLAVAFSVLVGAALLGMLGALLAVPAAASIQLALSDVLWRRRYAMASARREAEHADEATDATTAVTSTHVG